MNNLSFNFKKWARKENKPKTNKRRKRKKDCGKNNVFNLWRHDSVYKMVHGGKNSDAKQLNGSHEIALGVYDSLCVTAAEVPGSHRVLGRISKGENYLVDCF